MAIGKRPKTRQDELFVAASEIRALGNPFYRALNKLLGESGFDEFAEDACREYYAEKRGRPGIPPGVYFRMMMVGYLEGIGSERGIAWRCADSISLREFLGYGLAKNPPEHSGLSKTRKRLSVEAHAAVFGRVLELLKASGLLSGKTLGVDSTTLEANAALRSIVRRDDGKGYEEWLEQVARASGIETPTREDLAKPDRKRPKKGSNKDWMHPNDPEARITKMKDGRTHLAHKFEQAADMETGAVVAVTVQTMDGGDVASLPNTLDEAERQLAEVGTEPQEVVADKGYHANKTMTGVKDRGLRSYVSEPDRGPRKWKRNRDAQQPTYANRRRIRGNRGKRLLRQRGEKVERGFAHLLVTGGMRRVHLRGQENIRKRMLIHAAAFNLGLLMRKRCGFGTPRGLQGLAIVQAALATQITTHVLRFFRRIRRHFAPPGPDIASSHPKTRFLHNNTAPACLSSLPALIRWEPVSSTGFYDDRNRAPAPYKVDGRRRGHPGESESCECHFSDNTLACRPDRSYLQAGLYVRPFSPASASRLRCNSHTLHHAWLVPSVPAVRCPTSSLAIT